MDLELKNICLELKAAQQKLALQNAAQKNAALLCVLDSIKRNSEKIFAANKIDVERAKKNGMSEALVD
ncbi:MAG: gamma-glutamyl-phosphate reductase, partial [Treponemataceae bacterium]|nr:gamma-glutamyl-phosphate reductase [Treponemataceae bacterium]